MSKKKKKFLSLLSHFLGNKVHHTADQFCLLFKGSVNCGFPEISGAESFWITKFSTLLKIWVLKLLTLIIVDGNLPKNLSEYTVYLYFFMKLQIIITISSVQYLSTVITSTSTEAVCSYRTTGIRGLFFSFLMTLKYLIMNSPPSWQLPPVYLPHHFSRANFFLP